MRNKKWQSEQLRQCNGDAKSSWKTLKTILNWNLPGAPTKLFYKGELKTKLQEVANCQNESFIDKIKEIQQELPAQKNDPMKFLKNITTSRKCSLEFSPVHPDEVSKIIDNLNNTSAFGLDEIDTFIIKLIKDEITPALTNIINLSLASGTFPEKWKSPKIICTRKIIV